MVKSPALRAPRGRLAGTALVGARRAPIEDFPDDTFERTIPREIELRRGQSVLVASLIGLYAPGAPLPRLKRARPLGLGVFGGRWLEKSRGIVLWAHPNAILEKAVTIHEVCHYLRCLYGGDGPGEHDAAFLALVEDAYRTWGIPVDIAKLVEGQFPEHWRW